MRPRVNGIDQPQFKKKKCLMSPSLRDPDTSKPGCDTFFISSFYIAISTKNIESKVKIPHVNIYTIEPIHPTHSMNQFNKQQKKKYTIINQLKAANPPPFIICLNSLKSTLPSPSTSTFIIMLLQSSAVLPCFSPREANTDFNSSTVINPSPF